MSTIEQTEAVAHHLESLCNEIYATLGERHITITNNQATIALHVMAREFGELAESFRDLGPHRANAENAPSSAGVIVKVLNDAFDADESGAIVLYAMCVEIIPRFMISLRDVPELVNAQSGARVIDRARRASAVAMSQLHVASELLRTLGNQEILTDPAARYDQWLRDAGADERF
jgi:hypothetical protein